MTLTDQQLLTWNRQGLIPGPDETEEQFSCRAKQCLHVDRLLPECAQVLHFSAIKASLAPQEKKITKELFDCTPEWIPLFFSNYRLSPWQGGCTWILQRDDQEPPFALLQLNKAFKDKEIYLKLYTRQELVTHECAHVGRMAFNEPAFEEILAYQTSASPLRRWLGPIIQSPWEAILFFSLLFLTLFAMPFSDPLFITLLLGTTALLAVGIFRLSRRQRQFKRCLKQLSKTVDNHAHALIFRLTDREIRLFSRSTPTQIHTYASQQHSLRWRLLKLAYLIEGSPSCSIVSAKASRE